MFTIAKFIAGLFGWDIQKVQKWLVIIVMAIVAGLLLMGIILLRNCGKKPPVLDQKAITEAQEVIANQSRKDMEDFKANVAANVAAIDANVANAKALAVNAAVESRKDSANKSNEELAAEIEQMLRDSQ